MPKLDSTLTDILLACSKSTKVCAKVLFPDRFTLPFSDKIHAKIFDFLDNEENPLRVICAPRGTGKTSIITLVTPASDILFNRAKFILQVSSSNTGAEMQTENLKQELETNEIICKLVGSQKSDRWARDQWVTREGVMVMPRGAGQQVRGLLHGNYRPDRILVDDLEDDETVMNPDRRAKLKQWFYSALMNCVDKGKKTWKLDVIGTILHEASLLAELIEDPNWASLVLEICDDDYKSNWPEFMSDDDVRAEAKKFADQGLLDSFYREYRNKPIATESAHFRQEYFRKYDEGEMQARWGKLDSFVIWDPAKTIQSYSCETAIVGITIDLEENAIFIRDVVHGKLHPDEQYKQVVEMAVRLDAKAVGIEVTSLNEYITHPFKDYMLGSGFVFEVVELKPRDKKEERIAAMIPYYRTGKVFHNPHCCGALEVQLLTFPRSKLLDVADATAYFVQMMDVGERYFCHKQPGGWSASEEMAYKELLAQDMQEKRVVRSLV